ncbi:iron ABC transporter permease [Actinoallomurus purpureus]|uniref:iron chelate uptake ABC transporter family permease subunit n=1 Tax=Actinoallomurus purpureus TaxID=478114 RepID=UPI0020924CD5|nr:iron chelate uptake ABC transporter family permease subunit [Actinoallomurus purpureus]MCO6005399.1 iron ABC transporter permease [Actinoallomurus purpureus]
MATGAAGPVDFVALLAPQIARRLTRTIQIPLLSSALAGALVVVVADLLARRLFAPIELPVGVLTAVVGGPVPDVAHRPYPQPFRMHHPMSRTGTSRLTRPTRQGIDRLPAKHHRAHPRYLFHCGRPAPSAARPSTTTRPPPSSLIRWRSWT